MRLVLDHLRRDPEGRAKHLSARALWTAKVHTQTKVDQLNLTLNRVCWVTIDGGKEQQSNRN